MTAANASFYQVGGTLPGDSPAYVTRQADADLYAGLRASQFCYVLNSRQMGKSSLRVRVMQRLQAEGVACAAIDITAIGSQSPNVEQWYAGVARQLLAGLGLTGQLPLRSWWKEREYLPPVDRLGALIEWLLGAVEGNIAIFVDEIDSVLSLQFPIDDFFAFIRACYNLRVDRPEYERITFALFGVATPGELIRDKTRTPFNVGRAIEVEGFTAGDVAPLAAGLGPRGSEILAEILDWTGGQPFLTQRVCRLVAGIAPSSVEIPPSPPNSYGEATPTKGGDQEGSEVPLLKGDLGGSVDRGESIPPSPPDQGGDQSEGSEVPLLKGDLGGSIAHLIQTQVIDHWEANDEQTHLRTIRDRVLQRPEQERREILGIYQRVLGTGSVRAEDSPEQMALRLSGLVVKRDGRLWSYNRIYRSVFDGAWIEGELARLCPFAEQMMAWMRDGDASRLLRGQALREGREWGMAQVRLRSEEVGFIQASLDLERQEERAAAQGALAAQEEANRILQAATAEAEGKLAVAEEEAERKVAAATRKANRRNAVSLVGAALALTVAAIAGASSIKAGFDRDRAQQEVKQAEQEKGQLVSEKAQLESDKTAQETRLRAIEQKEKIARQNAQIAQKQVQQAKQNLVAAKQKETAAQQQAQQAQQQAQQAKQQAVLAETSARLAGQQERQAVMKVENARKLAENARIEEEKAKKAQESAVANLQETRNAFEKSVEDAVVRSSQLDNLENLLLQSGNLLEIEKILLAYIQLWESLRSDINDDLRAKITEKLQNSYKLLQRVLVDQKRFNEALEVSERSRAWSFAELLAHRISAKSSSQINLNSPTIQQLKKVANEHKAVLVEYSIIYENSDNSALRQELALYIWVVKPDSDKIEFRQVSLKGLPQQTKNPLQQSIDLAWESIISAFDEPDTSRLEMLLIQPIKDLLPADPNVKIIFIPQDIIFQAPFPALQDLYGKYLIEKHTILTAPSIQALNLTRQQRRKVRSINNNPLIVGNPNTPLLSQLPGSEIEARQIAKLFNIEALVGKQATKSLVLQRMPSSGLIHFTTHSVSDTKTGQSAKVFLTPTKEDDGVLKAGDILNLQLSAELAVFSGGETFQGGSSSDGIAGLSYSLIAAGVPSVIMTLSEVDDYSTSILMTEFYHNLLNRKLDKASALRQAMLMFIKNKNSIPNYNRTRSGIILNSDSQPSITNSNNNFQHPYYWSMFTLVGEYE